MSIFLSPLQSTTVFKKRGAGGLHIKKPFDPVVQKERTFKFILIIHLLTRARVAELKAPPSDKLVHHDLVKIAATFRGTRSPSPSPLPPPILARAPGLHKRAAAPSLSASVSPQATRFYWPGIVWTSHINHVIMISKPGVNFSFH